MHVTEVLEHVLHNKVSHNMSGPARRVLVGHAVQKESPSCIHFLQGGWQGPGSHSAEPSRGEEGGRGGGGRDH